MTQPATSTLSAAPATDPQAEAVVPPHARLWDLATRAVAARCLHVVAELGVADAVDPDGSDIGHLAVTLGVEEDALGRILRLLAAHQVFDVALPRVCHTEASLLLRRDHPMSMGAFAHMMGLPMAWDAIGLLNDTVRTGHAGIFALDPDGLFAYLARHPLQRAVFDQAMTAKSHAGTAAVLDAYDFAAHRTVADVGGGSGHLLRAISVRYPGVSGTLVELPEVIDSVAQGRQLDRVQLVAADFFVDDLPVADVYVLMEIIHDWDDDDAIRILSNLRRIVPDHAVVLIIESVLDDTPGPDAAKTLDIVMLSVTGGRERTPANYRSILDAAGFQMRRIIPTRADLRIVEAQP